MTAGRKPKNSNVVDAIDAQLDQAKIGGAMALMQAEGMAQKQTHEMGLFDLGRQVGAIQLSRMQRDFLQAAEIRLFEEIKKSNKYKDLPVPREGGVSAAAENAEEFCALVFGKGYKAMNEASLNLRALGDSAYESASRLGLNRNQLRLIRSLPEDQITAVQLAITSESKAEVIAVIEDLAAKLAEVSDKNIELANDIQDATRLSAEKSVRIDQLKKAQRRIDAMPPDEVLSALQKEATSFYAEAKVAISGQLRQACIAIKNHGDGTTDNSRFMAGLLGQLQADLTALRTEFDLPDVSNARDHELLAEQAQWANS